MKFRFKKSIQIDGFDDLVEVEGNYWPATWDTREEPGTAAEVEIEFARFNGQEVDLTDEQREKAEEKINESMFEGGDENC